MYADKPAVAPDLARPGSGAQPVSLSWRAPTGMVVLSLVNFLLRIVTLGIYHFWGKTEVRKRIWGAVRLDGEPLAYTGTGRELFVGFLIVFAVVLLPTLLVSVAVILALGPGSPWIVVYNLGVYLVFSLLLGIGLYRAQRYRLARTEWRGVRGRLEGSSWRYGWTYLWTALLIPLTLGWILPWRLIKLRRAMTENTFFGDERFGFTGRSGPLYRRFFLVWLLGLVIVGGGAFTIGRYLLAAVALRDGPDSPIVLTPLDNAIVIGIVLGVMTLLGLLVAWYQARVINHVAAHTHFQSAVFRATATGLSLVWLTLSNWLLVVLTLGLLAPIAQVRAARYVITRLSIDGPVDLARVAQAAAEKRGPGEGLAEAFDVDAF